MVKRITPSVVMFALALFCFAILLYFLVQWLR